MKTKFYICRHCGNIVAYVEDKGVPVFCCGEKMQPLEPNTIDAANEKHLPVISVKDDVLTVNVGEVTHPMTEEHHISWVYVLTEKGGQRKALDHTGMPEAQFVLKDDKAVAVYAYCNLHGLWMTEL